MKNLGLLRFFLDIIFFEVLSTLGLNVKSDLSIYNVLSKLTHKKANLEDIKFSIMKI